MFWKNWEKHYKYPYLIFIGLLGLLIVLLLKYYFSGYNPVIDWNSINKLENTQTILDTFKKGLFNFKVKGKSYIIFEQFAGSPYKINYLITWLFLIITVLGINILFATFTYIKNYLYYIATAALLFYFVNLRIDILKPLDIHNNAITIFPIFFFGGLSYLFNSFYTKAPFWLRLLSFLMFSAVFFVIIGYLSKEPNPYLTIANYGILAPVILTFIFISMISFEIIYGILYITTSPNKGEKNNSILHFFIMSILYLGNLILLYLHNIRFLSLDIYYIPAFWVFILSTILGIWGFRMQNTMFSNKLPFYPYGAFVYLGLSLIAFSTIIFYFATGNDPMIEVFEDAILFAHIGFGGSFFLYSLINYYPLFGEGYKVYRYVYKPYQMPFFLIFATGSVIILLLLTQNNYFVYNQYNAGYYNGLGDVYRAAKDYYVADKYYRWGEGYEFQNHKSNYSLAHLTNKLDKKNPGKKIEYLKNSLKKKPSPYAYANLGISYLNQDMKLKAMFILEEGMKKFPDNVFLKNNMGIIYHKLNLTDSAFYYLHRAYKENKKFFPALSNAYAVSIDKKQPIPYNWDTLSKKQGSITYHINRLAWQTHQKHKKPYLNKKYVPDSALGNFSFRYIYNYGASAMKNIDTTFINKVHYFEKENPLYKKQFQFLRSGMNYYSYKKGTAFKIMNNLQYGRTPNKAHYLNTLGLWLMKSNLNQFAAEVFNDAKKAGDDAAAVKKAIALMEAGKFSKAKKAWHEDAITKDSIAKNLAKNMQLIMNINNFNNAMQSGDRAKYCYFHYYKEQLLDKEILSLIKSLQKPDLKINAMLEAAKFFLKKDKINSYKKFNSLIESISDSNFSLKQKKRIRFIKTYALYKQENWNTLKNNLEKWNENNNYSGFISFFKGVLAEKNKNQKEARQYYQVALNRLPFNEEVIPTIVNFYEKKINNSEKAYDIINEALDFNPYSIRLRKLYCVQSLRYGIPFFAEGGLKKLKPLLSKKAFKDFKEGAYAKAYKEYEKKIK